MYRFPYLEIIHDTPLSARERERLTIEHSIGLLKVGQESEPNSRERIEAICFTRRYWAFFIEDLARPENNLPKQRRADLISIGIWIMREAEEIRLGNSSNFEGLIDVSQIIADGLQ